jgi:hypothetical protein
MANLVLWLDGARPGTTSNVWTDVSSSAFQCVLVNTPILSNNNGGYFSFNGRDTYGIIEGNPAFVFGTGDFTIEAWVWVNSRQNDPYQHLGGTHNAGVGYGWFNTVIYANYANEDQVLGYTEEVKGGLGLMPIGVWKHVVTTRISGQVRFYRDGVGGPPISYTRDMHHSATLLVGAIRSNNALPAQYVDGAYNLNGRIAQFRIYKGKGLTQAEVVNNYNAHISRYS